MQRAIRPRDLPGGRGSATRAVSRQDGAAGGQQQRYDRTRPVLTPEIRPRTLALYRQRNVPVATPLELISSNPERDGELLDVYSQVVTRAVERVAASVIKIDVTLPARGRQPERSGSGSGF